MKTFQESLNEAKVKQDSAKKLFKLIRGYELIKNKAENIKESLKSLTFTLVNKKVEVAVMGDEIEIIVNNKTIDAFDFNIEPTEDESDKVIDSLVKSLSIKLNESKQSTTYQVQFANSLTDQYINKWQELASQNLDIVSVKKTSESTLNVEIVGGSEKLLSQQWQVVRAVKLK